MKHFFYVFFGLIGLAFSSVFAQAPNPATTRYVSTTGTTTDPASATSWATSTADLQAAINSLSATGGEVWVAAGTYTPTTYTGPDSRAVSFSMVDGVAIYGGFDGDEMLLSDREPLTYGSILSGDIGTTDDNSDNSYHVIWSAEAITNTAILDGFLITKGSATYSSSNENEYGGGMYNLGSPLIRNCHFEDNVATGYLAFGGGRL